MKYYLKAMKYYLKAVKYYLKAVKAVKFYLRAANLIKGAQDPLLGRLRVLGIATRGDLYNSKTIGSEVAKKKFQLCEVRCYSEFRRTSNSVSCS